MTRLPCADPDGFRSIPARSCHGCVFRVRRTGGVPGNDCRHPLQPAPCVPSLRDDGRNVRIVVMP